jgi:hypothetical protein
MNRRPRNVLLLASGLLALSGMAFAAGGGGSMRDIGDYTVHYNAMPASALDPSLAERFDLPRSDKRCVVTVAVTEDASGDMVSARIMASATRADGRMYKLDMRAIEDTSGMYYIGDLPMDAPGTMNFRLEIQPNPDMPPQTIRFTRELSAP